MFPTVKIPLNAVLTLRYKSAKILVQVLPHLAHVTHYITDTSYTSRSTHITLLMSHLSQCLHFSHMHTLHFTYTYTHILFREHTHTHVFFTHSDFTDTLTDTRQLVHTHLHTHTDTLQRTHSTQFLSHTHTQYCDTHTHQVEQLQQNKTASLLELPGIELCVTLK